jgi:hypothetical protein
MDWPVASIAVTATLVVRDDIPDDIVSLVLWTFIEDYRQLASTLNFLPAEDPLGMNQDGLSAPMHPGASAVYDEFARRAQTVKP